MCIQIMGSKLGPGQPYTKKKKRLFAVGKKKKKSISGGFFFFPPLKVFFSGAKLKLLHSHFLTQSISKQIRDF